MALALLLAGGLEVTAELLAALLAAVAGVLLVLLHRLAVVRGEAAALVRAGVASGHRFCSNGVFHTASRPSERSHSRIDLQTNGKEYQKKRFLSIAARPKTKKVVRI